MRTTLLILLDMLATQLYVPSAQAHSNYSKTEFNSLRDAHEHRQEAGWILATKDFSTRFAFRTNEFTLLGS
ncbi:MAG: hypothetical protein HOP30_08555 [Cyclobacteriaceae bacterium]|nr:hypothetical protein [Cyclobacteriaceae bacterium]